MLLRLSPSTFRGCSDAHCFRTELHVHPIIYARYVTLAECFMQQYFTAQRTCKLCLQLEPKYPTYPKSQTLKHRKAVLMYSTRLGCWLPCHTTPADYSCICDKSLYQQLQRGSGGENDKPKLYSYNVAVMLLTCPVSCGTTNYAPVCVKSLLQLHCSQRVPPCQRVTNKQKLTIAAVSSKVLQQS